MPVYRHFYKSRLLATGITFLCLGTGNWIVGSRKIAHYRAVLVEAPAVRSGDASASTRTVGFRRRVREVDGRAAIARNKLDLYHVVASGGRLMVSLGLLSVVAAIVSWRRRRQAGGVHVGNRVPEG
jgi:hypothetical protein